MKKSSEISKENGISYTRETSKGGARINNFATDFARGKAGEYFTVHFCNSLGLDAYMTGDKNRDDVEAWYPHVPKSIRNGSNFFSIEVKTHVKYGLGEKALRGYVEAYVDENGVEKRRIITKFERPKNGQGASLGEPTGNIFIEITSGKQENKGLNDALKNDVQFFINFIPGLNVILMTKTSVLKQVYDIVKDLPEHWHGTSISKSSNYVGGLIKAETIANLAMELDPESTGIYQLRGAEFFHPELPIDENIWHHPGVKDMTITSGKWTKLSAWSEVEAPEQIKKLEAKPFGSLVQRVVAA